MLFEMLIQKRPVSLQVKNRQHLREWKKFVSDQARENWQGLPCSRAGIHLTLVYLCGDAPADIDNIIKPIQDALVGVVLDDDAQITDVDSHRRSLTDKIDITHLPALLKQGVILGVECVYVRVSFAKELEHYL